MELKEYLKKNGVKLIFEDEASCVACYKKMLKNAIEALEKEMNDLP